MAKVPGFANAISSRWCIVEMAIRLRSRTRLSSSTACSAMVLGGPLPDDPPQPSVELVGVGLAEVSPRAQFK
jgi:hypothetical protein